METAGKCPPGAGLALAGRGGPGRFETTVEWFGEGIRTGPAGPVGRHGHPISRVLSAGPFRIGWADRRTPSGRSSIYTQPRGWALAADPELEGNEPLPVPKDFAPAWPCSWRGLPGRRHCCRRRWSLTPPFHPYPRVKAPRGPAKAGCAVFDSRAVVFCGPIRGLPRPGVTRHPALGSADFPRTSFAKLRTPAIARMAAPI
jgi:hypothetical protein